MHNITFIDSSVEGLTRSKKMKGRIADKRFPYFISVQLAFSLPLPLFLLCLPSLMFSFSLPPLSQIVWPLLCNIPLNCWITRFQWFVENFYIELTVRSNFKHLIYVNSHRDSCLRISWERFRNELQWKWVQATTLSALCKSKLHTHFVMRIIPIFSYQL